MKKIETTKKVVETKNIDAGETLDKTIVDIETQLSTGFKGIITEINPITNKLFFGDTGAYDERDGWSITVKLNNGEEFSNWFGKPSVRGYESSNLFAFKKKYASNPKVGLSIECYLDENGFFRIRL